MQRYFFGVITETGHTHTPHMHAYDHHHGSNEKVRENLMFVEWHLQCILTVYYVVPTEH
jgi:hypothetical protein